MGNRVQTRQHDHVHQGTMYMKSNFEDRVQYI